MWIFSITLISLTLIATEAIGFNEELESIDNPVPEFRTVVTANGAIRGQKAATLYEKRAYYSFKGIPYAKPPIGPLRFRVNTDFLRLLPHFLISSLFIIYSEATTKIRPLEWDAGRIRLWQ